MLYHTPRLSVSKRPNVLHDIGHWAERELVKLPFKSVLSLEPLIQFWEVHAAEDRPAGTKVLYEHLRRELDRHPELRGEISDADVLRRHADVMDLLMFPVFPPASRESDLLGAAIPFDLQVFYCTPPFGRFLVEEDGKLSGKASLDVRTYTYGKIIVAYLHILRSVYGVGVPFDFPLLFTAEDPQTGLDRYLKITSDLRFLKINQVGELGTLTHEMHRRLLTNLSDLDVWLKLIPSDSFEFFGFDIIRAADVTDVEVVSLLERDLLEGESIVSGAGLPTLRDRMRVLLRQPGLEFGLAAVEAGHLFKLHKPTDALPDCLFRRASHYDLTAMGESLFGKALRHRSMQVVDDLESYDMRTAIEDEMLECGARSMIAAPLYLQEKAMGVLYLWSREPGVLSALNLMSLLDVLPLLSAAVRRGKEELENRIQSVILGKYTAIHPSVQWRFRKAALAYIRKQEMGIPAEVEPIVLHDIYPLYAASDIRSSATHRIEAVQADLMEHLNEVADLLRYVRARKELPILEYLQVRTERFRDAIGGAVSSGDEASVRSFLAHDIEPVFQHFRQDPELRERIVAYYEALDPEHGSMYRRQREYDESVKLINRTISSYLDVEEAKAQEAFPHYFEKHETDGVEFTIYAGASLLENGEFDELYVRNLRLWQLMVVCGICRRVAPLKDTLKVPLETTHLILTQSNPLSIRFRFEETRFDVDGTHHIRYEIMKQRTEKATIKGRAERLVQPGKIAIVYSQAREAWEYADYIRFLQETGYLKDEVEEVELADLQGMVGLKALRVAVNLDDHTGRDEPKRAQMDTSRLIGTQELSETVRN